MPNGSKIDNVEQRVHLGTARYFDIFISNIDNTVNELFMKTNNLMSDFQISTIVPCQYCITRIV